MTTELDVRYAIYAAEKARQRSRKTSAFVLAGEKHVERIDRALNTPGHVERDRAKMKADMRKTEAALPRARARAEEAQAELDAAESELRDVCERYLAEDGSRTAFWED